MKARGRLDRVHKQLQRWSEAAQAEAAHRRQREINAAIERLARRMIAGEVAPVSPADRARLAREDERLRRENPQAWEKRRALIAQVRRLVGEKEQASEAGGAPAATDEKASGNGGAVTN